MKSPKAFKEAVVRIKKAEDVKERFLAFYSLFVLNRTMTEYKSKVLESEDFI